MELLKYVYRTVKPRAPWLNNTSLDSQPPLSTLSPLSPLSRLSALSAPSPFIMTSGARNLSLLAQYHLYMLCYTPDSGALPFSGEREPVFEGYSGAARRPSQQPKVGERSRLWRRFQPHIRKQWLEDQRKFKLLLHSAPLLGYSSTHANSLVVKVYEINPRLKVHPVVWISCSWVSGATCS